MNRTPLHRVHSEPQEAQHVLAVWVGAPVEGLPPRPDHAANQLGPQPGSCGGLNDMDPRAGANAARLGERHHVERLVVKTHHLGLHCMVLIADDLTDRPQGRHESLDLKRQPDHPRERSDAVWRGRRGPSNQAIRPLIQHQ